MDERNPINVFVGDKIRVIRRASGLTQSDLGDAVGVTYQMIQKYERGASSISVPLLFKVAQALRHDVTSFLPISPRSASLARFDPDVTAAFDLLVGVLEKYGRAH